MKTNYIPHLPAYMETAEYNQKINEIVSKAKESGKESDLRFCQIMTMLLYELYPQGCAMEMAGRSATLPLVPVIYRQQKDKGWSYNETAFSMTDEYKTFEDRCRQFSTNVGTLQTLPVSHPLAEFFTDITGVFVLSEKHRVYTYRDRQGYMVLLSYVDTADYIIADEEMFNGEPPLWFTESRHFISPVWAMKEVHWALQKLWAETGMTRVPVRFELILTQKANIILNEPDMWEYQWASYNLKIHGPEKADKPLDCLSKDELPMHHLWRHFYSMIDKTAFREPYDDDGDMDGEHLFDDDEDADIISRAFLSDWMLPRPSDSL